MIFFGGEILKNGEGAIFDFFYMLDKIEFFFFEKTDD
jgi:hypothetical protein